MKKIFISVLSTMVIVSTSCKKSNDNKTCWDCEVRRNDGTTYKDRTCTSDGRPPQYTDDRGNDLNSICTKR